VAIKTVHTLAWLSIESSVAYALYSGLARRSDRRAAIAAAVVAGESLIFVGNRCRCPLTQVAEQLGIEQGSVTDIYLPGWFARNLPAIHVPLIVLAVLLHVRNLRCGPECHRLPRANVSLTAARQVRTGNSQGGPMAKTKVLFLCTRNTARSQMAEAFLRTYGGETYEAYSAGLEPREIDPLTIRVMTERGIDIQGQRAKGLDEYLGREHFGVLVTVCARAERGCPVFPGVGTRLHWAFDDPVAAEGDEDDRLEKFRAVRDAIELQVREWLRERTPTPA
jgi:arsenate reductase